jgi:acetolactate synthase-1/2/3 large subunit
MLVQKRFCHFGGACKNEYLRSRRARFESFLDGNGPDELTDLQKPTDREGGMATCAETLKGLGIRRMFGVPGGEILDLVEASRKLGIDFILTRHESAAAFMADVTGQITGVPGVCLSTVGPGATNLINGVANAYLDRSPTLVFTAQLSTGSQPYANHQFIHLERLFEPVTKKVFTATGRNTRDMIKEGFHIATTKPKGPAYFCLPSDVLRDQEMPPSLNTASPFTETLPEIIDPKLIPTIVEEIRKAQKPLVLLGIGIDPREDTETIRKFIRKNNFPVMGTPKVKGVFPDSDPLYLGTASGMMADDLILSMIMQADLVIGLGFDPVESDKIWHKDIKLLSINSYGLTYKSYQPYMEAIGNIRTTLDLLMEEDFSEHGWKKEDLKKFKESLGKKLTPSRKPMGGLFSPYRIIQKTREALPRQAVVTTDVGANKYIMGQAWKAYHPLTFLMSNGLSSMGYGLPAAIAAKLSLPRAKVVCVTGDGGFSMMLHDLETAVRLSLPLVIMVFCDGSLGLIEMVQKRRGFPLYGVNFSKIRFASVAKDFGARGIKLRSLEELPRIFSTGFDSDRPTVIEIPIDGAEYMDQL